MWTFKICTWISLIAWIARNHIDVWVRFVRLLSYFTFGTPCTRHLIILSCSGSDYLDFQRPQPKEQRGRQWSVIPRRHWGKYSHELSQSLATNMLTCSTLEQLLLIGMQAVWMPTTCAVIMWNQTVVYRTWTYLHMYIHKILDTWDLWLYLYIHDSCLLGILQQAV